MRTLRQLAIVVAATAVMGPIALAAAPGAMAATTVCKSGTLPVTVVGAPGVKAQQALGVYLWHDGSGYSLRATHPGKDRVTITGTITVSESVHGINRIKLEKNDSVQVGRERKTVAFKFNNYGYIDGFNFTTACSRTVRVVVNIGAAQAAPAQVFLGKDRINPTSVPFTIERAHDNQAAKIS